MNYYPSRKLPMVYLHTQEAMLQALRDLGKREALAVDTETTGLNWWAPNFRVFYMSICDGKKGYGFLEPFKYPRVVKALKDLLSNPKMLAVFMNAKFDCHAFRVHGVELTCKIEDAQFLARLLNENEPANLEYQSKTYLGPSNEKLSASLDAWFKEHKQGKENRHYDQLPLKLLEPYAVQDTIATWFLWKGHRNALREADATHPMDEVEGPGPRGLERIYEIENAAVKPLMDIECRGYIVDQNHFKKLGPHLEDKADGIKEKLFKSLDRTYGYKVPSDTNLDSPDFIAELFIGVLGIDPERLPRTDKDAISFDARALEDLDHPIADALLEYRAASKLASTFGPSLLANCTSDSALHVNYNQMRPVTGRMSCSDPNIQNLPRVDTNDASADCNRIREGFLARPGYNLFYFDYSQIEMRLAAHYFMDPVMLEAIRSGADLHRVTASIMFGKPQDKVTKMERQQAKTVNFATIYGSGAKGLVKTLNKGLVEALGARAANKKKIHYMDAKAFKNNYLMRFPSIKQFFAECEGVVQERGFVRTFYGRRRHLAADKSHIAPNAIIQGTGADIHKIGIERVNALARKGGWGGIVNVVHDDQAIEIRKGCEKQVVPQIMDALQNFQFFEAPITVDVEMSSTTWAAKQKWKL